MLSVYELNRVVNESAQGTETPSDYSAHEFYGTVQEAAYETLYALMSESVEAAAFQTGADEILAESAMMNNGKLDVLTESVFNTISTGFKNFLHKCGEFIKGMIVKIKNFLTEHDKKTQFWLKSAKPKLDKLVNTKAEDTEIEVFKWDYDYIKADGKLVEAMQAFKEEYTAVNEEYGKAKELAESLKAVTDAGDKATARSAEAADNDIKAVDSKFVAEAAKALGVSGETMEDVLKNTTRAIYPAEKAKSTPKACGGINKMVENLEGITKACAKIVEVYKGELAEIKKLEVACGKVESAAKKDANGNKAAISEIQTITKITTKRISNIRAFMTNVQNKELECIRVFSKDYMTALSAVIRSAKPEKEKKDEK